MVMNDFKYVLRLLLKKPGFTILTTLVMATGIGLSVFLFSFLNTAIFKDLPFKDGESIVQMSSSLNGARTVGMINLHDYEEVRSNLNGLSEFGSFKNLSLNVTGKDGARRYSAVAAESNIFEISRTEPILGRGFNNLENQSGAERVVVIGYDAWQNQFSGDPNIIGEVLRVNGESHRVIGVMPEGYFFPFAAEMWVPLRENASQTQRSQASDIFGLAHLSKGVSKQDVNRDLALIMQRIEERYPKTNSGVGAYIETIPLTGIQDGAPVIYSLQVIVFLILILASINVGGLLLSRAIERGKETAIRVALGAPRLRLISQVLWESIIVCCLGGVIGLLVLAWGLEVTESTLATFNPDRPAFWLDFGVDSYTLTITLFFVLSTILITGLLPAWRNSGGDFNAVLRDGTRGSLGKKTGRLNKLLVIIEIFVAMAVLIVVGIMSLANFKSSLADYGADPENILTAQLLLTGPNYDSDQEKVQFLKTLQSRLERESSISDVMFSSALPGVISPVLNIALEGKEYTEDRGYPSANYIVSMPGTLDKLGVELKNGRYFDNSDDGTGKSTVIVTESFVSRHFPDESPIGKRFRVVEEDDRNLNWLTIVGVVEHTIQGSPVGEIADAASIFRPFSQQPNEQMTVAMRMNADSAEITRTLRSTIASLDPELPAFRIEAYTKAIDRLTGPFLFATALFLIFGAAIAVLASSGLYGVMSNTINQRTHEIGVKRALGATEQKITKEFLWVGFKQLLWGGIPGILAGGALGVALQAENSDLVLVVITLAVLIGGTVMLATYLPTKRALEMEPSESLRYE